jgi:dual specificity tyrosine-phosphorylation-regulated kinase 2/3/4
MRHPFITGSRRAKVISPSPARTLLSSSSLTSRAKQVAETPKKSQISAPTPLTARTSRTTANVVPSTPSSSSVHSTVGSSSRYRSSQSQSLSSSHFSSRTLNGYVSTASTK